MHKWLSLLILLLAFPLSAAEIYKWVDEKGNVHYGDAPGGAGAKPLTRLPGLSTYRPPALPKLEERKSAAPSAAEPSQASAGYRMVKVVSPEPQATIRSAPGEVPVFVALDPVLREGHYLQVILDGKPLPQKHASTVIQLSNVDRGEHRIAVAVYDADGKLLKQSESHVFYLHRTIVKRHKSP